MASQFCFFVFRTIRWMSNGLIKNNKKNKRCGGSWLSLSKWRSHNSSLKRYPENVNEKEKGVNIHHICHLGRTYRHTNREGTDLEDDRTNSTCYTSTITGTATRTTEYYGKDTMAEEISIDYFCSVFILSSHDSDCNRWLWNRKYSDRCNHSDNLCWYLGRYILFRRLDRPVCLL